MRCFVAIELPAEVQRQLGALQERLRALQKAVRWSRPEQIHLTIKFLGEVPDGQAPAVCAVAQEAAAAYAPFELEVRGTGCFPPAGQVRVLWAGLADLPPALTACWRACEQGYAALGFAGENRPFNPHLTLGRVRDFSASARIRAALKEQEQFSVGRFTAEALSVFQSILKPAGPTYIPLTQAPFGR